MTSYRNKIYIILASATTAGYIWLYFKLFNGFTLEKDAYSGCIIKQVTNIPCPSCGSTRSISALLHGHFLDALYWNPFGLIIILIMAIIPFWLSYDILLKKDSLLAFYKKMEIIIRQKKVAIPLIFLVIINWIWNITKGL